jgi:hypothetical protein
LIGCVPGEGDDPHPFAVAKGRPDQNVIRLFLPYWGGGPVPAMAYEPPVKYAVNGEEPEKAATKKRLCRFQTLDIIGRTLPP